MKCFSTMSKIFFNSVLLLTQFRYLLWKLLTLRSVKSSRPEVFLRKGVLLHISRTPFLENNSRTTLDDCFCSVMVYRFVFEFRKDCNIVLWVWGNYPLTSWKKLHSEKWNVSADRNPALHSATGLHNDIIQIYWYFLLKALLV